MIRSFRIHRSLPVHFRILDRFLQHIYPVKTFSLFHRKIDLIFFQSTSRDYKTREKILLQFHDERANLFVSNYRSPRNVQTVEGRSSTVFAIKLKVTDFKGDLKIGMPADVVFK